MAIAPDRLENRPGKVARRPIPLRELLLLAALIALLLLGTLPPLINLGRFQQRIVGAISHAIGRPVSMDAVSLQMLPWPGFRIANLTVGEDPGFGQEPALRAPEVVLEPSLTSLWRGRFEISKVELTDASVNLVRNARGRWNISSVLLQASHISNAPTGARHAGRTPRFPYIDAANTRINFKHGAEKLPYSILNADFSMWLARPDVWGLRLEGQPARTDMPMGSGDTGTVRLEGEVHRATAFGVMPVSLDGEWSHAPLGQSARLLLGRDTGWRGQADLTAHFAGEIDALNVRAHMGLANLHWQDFTPEESFSADVTCRAHYSRDLPATDSFLCRWPLGDGTLALSSSAALNEAGRSLKLDAVKVPVPTAAAAVGLLHSSMPAPDTFSGVINGELGFDLATRRLTGSLGADAIQIAGAGPDGAPLRLTHLNLAPAVGSKPALALHCDPVALGIATAPVSLAAVLEAHRYSLSAEGSATLDALGGAEAALHLPVLEQVSPSDPGRSSVRLALTMSGPWRSAGPGSPAAGATGSLHLNDVLWQPAWLTAPVNMPAASIAVSPGMARWTIPAATLEAGTGDPLRFSATLQQALGCAPAAACETQFTIATPELSTAALETALASGHSALLSRVLARLDSSRLHLPPVEGTLHAQTFTLGRLPVHNASVLLSTRDLPQGAPTIRITSMDGQTLGGTLHLAGTVAASGDAPVYTLRIALNGASAAQAGQLWQADWGPGTLGGTANLTLAGGDLSTLLGSAHGTLQASWQGGALGEAVPHFASWDAAGVIGPDGLTLTQGVLSGTASTLTGSIGWDRSLHLTWAPAPGVASRAITGTLGEPVATPPAP